MSFADDDLLVDWDPTSASFARESALAAMDPSLDEEHITLVLENVNEDDFSFHALDHFSANANSNIDAAAPFLDFDGTPALTLLEHVANPCSNCALGGFSCKKITEGRHKGYCTSCVALGIGCSFAGASVSGTDFDLPANPWPVMGDHPAPTLPFGIIPQDISRSATPAVDGSDEVSRLGAQGAAPAKIGARFSRESVRILKNWLSTHNRHPYPSDEEKEALQRQTGLNKTQITNWLANARRRGKVQPPRSTSPHPGAWSWSAPMDVPPRRGTPALESMNPLQRWQNSPPEHEPASVTAIARAVTASSSSSAVLSSGLNSPYSFNYTDDGSSRSICNQSSTSSLGTSQSSNGSRGSAYSHGSRNSWGSFGSAPFTSRTRRRRRRRAGASKPGPNDSNSLSAPLKTFQCTFCTETFRTKHDWQRHEKSLHLSLERWVCAPNGPRAMNPETGVMSCVFCGEANPSDEHIEIHNYSQCQERTLEERTFYRKDHLNQHLRLVHNVKFMDWAMKQWKVATPQIRSRCGFCGIVMDTWTIRVDHLAEHFKTGYSMADWKGDWGFDVPVLDMVENSIPPYLIHHERVSPLPFTALHSPETPRNAFGLIKLELAYFGANHWEQHHRAPTDDEMRLEACRIIFASELLSLQGIATQESWLRDIIMADDNITTKARFGPLRGSSESRLATLKINGKDNLFEECPMEAQLQAFVKARLMLGLVTMDDELQEESCKIVGRVEETCTTPSDAVANWLLRRIKSSTDWLKNFRRRATLPRSEDVKDETVRSTDPKSIDSTIHSYSRLECELADYLRERRDEGTEPSDADLQRRARIIIYEFDDGWNQTAADNVAWLEAFRERHPSDSETSCSNTSKSAAKSPSDNDFQPTLTADGSHIRTTFFLHDANCYRRLARELRRWVKSTMSPNNPNCHVPSDEELQYQARWMLYDDDDPWNQTAADNAEWLLRFKRDVGILKDPGPGLPSGYQWALEQGGSGFAPPYAYPKGKMPPLNEDVHVNIRDGAKAFSAGHGAANQFLDTLLSEASRPAHVFCSRELEAGLIKYVQDKSAMPSDEELKVRAREILKCEKTAADDVLLLGKFKEYVRETMDVQEGEHEELPGGMEEMITDIEIGNILKDMDMDMDLGIGEVEEGEEGGVNIGPSVYD